VNETLVQACVRLYHTAPRVVIQSTLPRTLGKLSRVRRVIEQFRNLVPQIYRVLLAERDTCVSKYLHEGTKIRGYYGNGAQHILRNDEPENLACQRRDNNRPRAGYHFLQLRPWDSTCEAHFTRKPLLLSHPLKRSMFRAVAYDQNLYGAISFLLEYPRGFQQYRDSFCAHETPLKHDKRRIHTRGSWHGRNRR
jgi:hypothetical protein